jgi:hypothetical protein
VRPHFISVQTVTLSQIITWHKCLSYQDDVSRPRTRSLSQRSRSHYHLKLHIITIRVDRYTQTVFLSCIEGFWNNVIGTDVYLITTFCLIQEQRPFFKGQGHTYILKVHTITIRDYRFNYTKNNIKQLVTFILFSFPNICMLKKPFQGNLLLGWQFLFPSKLISLCCNFSMDWDRVKGFSAFVTCYLTIVLRPFLARHMSKIFYIKIYYEQ